MSDGLQWLSEGEYAGLVALCQAVPGPASSQVGFLIGLRRAGWAGAFAAWLGFTLPSAILLFAFAWLAPRLSGPFASAALHGLKLVAVAVVAQAVWGMRRRLCPDLRTMGLALMAGVRLLLISNPVVQLVALSLGAVGGVLLCRHTRGATAPISMPVGRRTGVAAGATFVALLVGLPLAALAAPHSSLGLAAIFYETGALVFGGGHVVLPLLHDALVPVWISDSAFLDGYGAAQAVPGPLFTFAAYLGSCIAPSGSGIGDRLLWSASAIFLFVPGMLIAVAALPLWAWFGHHPAARGALAGVNAAVVGVLGAALYNPIWTSAILTASDAAIGLIAWVLLERWRVQPIIVVGFCVAAAMCLAID